MQTQLVSTVTTKGQVVIPVQIRDQLGILPFDRMVFSLNGSTVVAQKAPKMADMFGFVKTNKKVTQKEMDRAVEEGFASDYS